MHEHAFLHCLSMDSGLRRRCNSGLTKSMRRASMLQARIGFKCVQMSASRLSSTNISFLLSARFPFALMPLLTLSVLAFTVRHGDLSVSLGSFMRSTIVLCLCTIVDRRREDYSCSTSFHWDCANTSQLCGMTLAPKTEPMNIQSIWPTEFACTTATCG